MKNQTYTTVATKVTIESYARLQSICKRYGFTLYDLLQMLCECLIRYMDDNHNLSYDLIRIIRIFEDLPGWKDTFRLTESLDKAEIVEAFYVLRRKGRTGERVVHISKPMLDSDANGWTVNANVQSQLERFIEITNHSLYKALRLVGVEMETGSVLDTLHRLVDLYKENPDEVELRRQFESNDWHQGAQVSEVRKYKRHNNHTEEYMNKLFD